MAHPQYTVISDYVLDQLFGYQDANELKKNIERVRIALAAEHEWSNTDDTNLGAHKSGVPSTVFEVFMGGGGAGSFSASSATNWEPGPSGLQHTDFTIDAGVTVTATNANSADGIYLLGVTGRFTMASGSVLNLVGLGMPGGGESPTITSNAANSYRSNIGGATGGGGYQSGTTGTGYGGGVLGQIGGAGGVSATAGLAAETYCRRWWIGMTSTLGPSPGGGGSNAAGGAGSAGGPLFIIEVNEWNFQAGATINLNGANSSNNGGTGAGGTLVVICKSTIANAGTITVAGGTPAGTPGGAAGGTGRYIVYELGYGVR